MVNIPLFTGFYYICQVVQDFYHQQYGGPSNCSYSRVSRNRIIPTLTWILYVDGKGQIRYFAPLDKYSFKGAIYTVATQHGVMKRHPKATAKRTMASRLYLLHKDMGKTILKQKQHGHVTATPSLDQANVSR